MTTWAERTTPDLYWAYGRDYDYLVAPHGSYLVTENEELIIIDANIDSEISTNYTGRSDITTNYTER